MIRISILIAWLFLLHSIECFPQSIAKSSEKRVFNVTPSLSKTILLRGPYLQIATPTSMVIRWRTGDAVKSTVRYGYASAALDKMIVLNEPVTEHLVKIEGLTPKTKYYYSIGDSGGKLQGNEDNYFNTLPIAGEEGIYRVGFFGDPGSYTTMQSRVRDQFLKSLGNKEMNAWVVLGDIAYNQGLDAEYQSKFFNVYKDKLLKKYPLFSLPGNHDYMDNDTAAFYHHSRIEYYKTFSTPVNGESGGIASNNQAYYSYDIGNIHFLSLDSFGQEDSTRLSDTLGAQVQWIKKDLEANKNKMWVVALWHHPPYSMGSHNSDEQDELIKIRENLLPVLERYQVDLVICGHSHLYERSKLMEGHYGKEATFEESKNNLSTSSGRFDTSSNSCPYIKATDKNNGTVYVVNGGSSELGGIQKSFPHLARRSKHT
jgi:Icc-related predicted phosphoesterase